MVEIKKREALSGRIIAAYANEDLHKGHVEWSMHGHDFFELELFLEGSGYQILNGDRHEIGEGTIQLITTSDFHEMVWEDIELVGLRFDQYVLDRRIHEKIFSLKKPLVFNLEGDEYECIKGMMHSLWKKEHSADNIMFKHELKKGILEAIVIMLINKVSDDTYGGKAEKNHVQRAISYIEMNFKNNPGLDEVSRYVGLNPCYFSGLFCNVTGKTFVRYLTDLKLEYSKNLIISTDMAMNEVCFNSGFKSFSNFSREFRKKYGTSPLKFRKKGNVHANYV